MMALISSNSLNLTWIIRVTSGSTNEISRKPPKASRNCSFFLQKLIGPTLLRELNPFQVFLNVFIKLLFCGGPVTIKLVQKTAA
jgi:hypothetical protein